MIPLIFDLYYMLFIKIVMQIFIQITIYYNIHYYKDDFVDVVLSSFSQIFNPRQKNFFLIAGRFLII